MDPFPHLIVLRLTCVSGPECLQTKSSLAIRDMPSGTTLFYLWDPYCWGGPGLKAFCALSPGDPQCFIHCQNTQCCPSSCLSAVMCCKLSLCLCYLACCWSKICAFLCEKTLLDRWDFNFLQSWFVLILLGSLTAEQLLIIAVSVFTGGTFLFLLMFCLIMVVCPGRCGNFKGDGLDRRYSKVSGYISVRACAKWCLTCITLFPFILGCIWDKWPWIFWSKPKHWGWPECTQQHS